MNTVINATKNHVELIKEVGVFGGFRLVAIKRGSDEVGFGLIVKDDNKVIIGGEDFNQINIAKLRLFSVSRFTAEKAKYKTTPEFFEAMVDILSFDL